MSLCARALLVDQGRRREVEGPVHRGHVRVQGAPGGLPAAARIRRLLPQHSALGRQWKVQRRERTLPGRE